MLSEFGVYTVYKQVKIPLVNGFLTYHYYACDKLEF